MLTMASTHRQSEWIINQIDSQNVKTNEGHRLLAVQLKIVINDNVEKQLKSNTFMDKMITQIHGKLKRDIYRRNWALSSKF